MSRLTRKDMKRDEVREGLGHVVDYVRDHGRELVIAMLAVAVLAAAVGGWLVYRSQRARAANNLLARAIQLHQAPIDPVAPQPDDEREPRFADEASRREAARAAFEATRQRYGASRIGAVAAAYLADYAAGAGDLAAARELWREAGDAPSSALSAQMVLNRLAADRAEGRAEEALEDLRGMLEDPDAPLPPEVVLDQMATTLELLGRDQEARETYQRIVDEFPQTAYAQRARQQAAAP